MLRIGTYITFCFFLFFIFIKYLFLFLRRLVCLGGLGRSCVVLRYRMYCISFFILKFLLKFFCILYRLCMYCIFHSLVTVVIFDRLCIIVYSIVIFDSDVCIVFLWMYCRLWGVVLVGILVMYVFYWYLWMYSTGSYVFDVVFIFVIKYTMYCLLCRIQYYLFFYFVVNILFFIFI